MTEQLAIAASINGEPSRLAGTCVECQQPVALRPPYGDAPYPALARSHDVPSQRVRDGRVPCGGQGQVPQEWRDWLSADPARLAAYLAQVSTWRDGTIHPEIAESEA